MLHPRLRDDATRMRMLLYGQLVSKTVCTAVQLGLPEALAGGPRSAEDLAREVEAHPLALRRLLRALVPFEVFTEEADGTFALTGLGTTLLPDTPGTARPSALLLAGEVGGAWGEFEHTVRTGESAFRLINDIALFEHLERRPERREVFDRSQEAGLRLELDEIFEAVTFDRYRRIVDVGGGNGHLMCELLLRTPGSTGIVVDLPGTVPLAEKRIVEGGLIDRCTTTAGDFFSSVTPGADLYILSHILHDWGDDSAVSILRTCAAAMPPHGRIMVIDLLTDAAADDHGGRHRLPALMDLYMLSLFGADGGRERTGGEFGALLADAGLEAEETLVLPSGMAVITARPIIG
ncbi:methyltransferase [Streptomyces sp. NBC_01498]|uniref:methyltransferase n=1 Tax=Streptomyces sp. NBC_01498 TaxID=2975870 RepID=UPI002E7ACB5A|nr:methyltransferase [Streptomyces sp. NBC_01498]WTL28380.1 methyltransferase [Streptomyces sp. NBC_01498]